MEDSMGSQSLDADDLEPLGLGGSAHTAGVGDGSVGDAGGSGGLQVTGSDVLNVRYRHGASPAFGSIAGFPSAGKETVGATRVTIHNSSDVDYMVTLNRINGLPLQSPLRGDDYIGLYVGNEEVPMMTRQFIAGHPSPVQSTYSALRVNAGETKYVWAYLWGRHGKSSFEQLDVVMTSFKLPFLYTSGPTGGPPTETTHSKSFHFEVLNAG